MEKKYQLDTEENKKFLSEMSSELWRFGVNYAAPGGSSYYLDINGTPMADRPRETWITSRMVHVYSLAKLCGFAGFDSSENIDAQILAQKGINGLLGELCDKSNGGWYAGLGADGEPLCDKQCYAHAFVILAASSAVLAGDIEGAAELLDKALATFDERFWDEKEGLTYDTYNTEFTELSTYRGLNANMHTVEAFLAVADATGDYTYRKRAGRIIDRVIVWAEENNWRIPEHYTADWQPDLECNKDNPADQFKPYGATPGHGIEWARLITQWAVSTFGEKAVNGGSGIDEQALSENVSQCAKYVAAAEELYNRAISDAWNTDGAPGICYTTDWEGRPVVRDRMHWTLAEAINTSAVLYRVTFKEKYTNDYADFMKYLDEYVLDKEQGSWFHQLDEKNNLLQTVWPGKPDIYHALQATLIPYADVSKSIARAMKG